MGFPKKKGAKTLHVPAHPRPTRTSPGSAKRTNPAKRPERKLGKDYLKKKEKKQAKDASAVQAKKKQPLPQVFDSTPKNASEPETSMVKNVSVAQLQSTQKMTNRQKCLVLGSHNMSAKVRHLMIDLKSMLPHCRSHEKIQSRDHKPDVLKELCALHHCNSCMLMEGRKHNTTFMWLVQMPAGPSVKFEVLNIHTAEELRMAGNCLKFSRALLHFDREFETVGHLRVIKALLTTLFNVPRYHPKSKPFIDHVFCFFFLDNRIWYRHYQVVTPPPPTPNKSTEITGGKKEPEVEVGVDGPTLADVAPSLYRASKSELEQLKLMEIGPRMVLNPLSILNGAFSGSVIYKNPGAQSPTEKRLSRKVRQRQKAEENERLAQKSQKHKELNPAPIPDPIEEIFKQ